MTIQEQLLAQLDDVAGEFETLRKRSTYDDISDLAEGEVIRFVTRARAAIERVAGAPSVYVTRAEAALQVNAYSGHKARALNGIVGSPRSWNPTYTRIDDTYGSDHYPLLGWIALGPECWTASNATSRSTAR